MAEPETGPAPPAPAYPPPAGPPRRAPVPTVSPALAEFGATIRALTPRGFVTEALIAINVLVFVVMVARGVSATDPGVPELLEYGANSGVSVLTGEWWRLLTSTFVHVGAIHLGMNMYVLWDAGRLMERVFGNAGFLVLYLAAGLCGSVASVAWHPMVVSAGASGAVFGVYGGLLGFLLRQRASIPREVLQRLGRGGLVFVGLNMMIGLSVKGIDQAAHMGGLAGGFLGGLVLAHPLDPAGASKRWARAVLLAVVAAVGIVAAVLLLQRS
jgi:rhomboid protease GluP